MLIPRWSLRDGILELSSESNKNGFPDGQCTIISAMQWYTSQLLKLSSTVNGDEMQVEDKALGYQIDAYLTGVGEMIMITIGECTSYF